MVAAEHIPMHFPAVFCLFPDHNDLSVVQLIVVEVKQFIVAFFCNEVIPIAVYILDRKYAMYFRATFEEIQDIVPSTDGG